MTKLNEYISSGIIESYCLGNLPQDEAKTLLDLASKNPEIQAEIDQTLEALENYGNSQSLPEDLKSRTLNFLTPFLSREKIDISKPPYITKYSDSLAWNEAVKDQQFELENENYAMRHLKSSPEVEINLVWLFKELVEEEHSEEDFLESFLILEGNCECDFEGKIVRFGPGDYFEVPIGVKHVIKNISEKSNFVKGIVQRRKVA